LHCFESLADSEIGYRACSHVTLVEAIGKRGEFVSAVIGGAFDTHRRAKLAAVGE
jgi:hypothetical protein